ncbi:hypothetical protein [Tranquillimonas alkanivorans]|uniref:hypothetical protein n=1 Tax=Tranquillimonas alkanivorans TaxID=441119 RepID=UPI001C432873|nr:hypothetical protein [Tranquillimonas alkanivorans]
MKDTIIIGSLFVTVPLIWWSWTSETMNPAKPEPSAEEQMESGARYACRYFIEPRLRNPDSADWGAMGDHSYASWPASADVGSGRVTVNPRFRAENGFGGMTISDWHCEVQKDRDDWVLVSLTEH